MLLVGGALLLLTAQPGGHNPPVAGHLRVAIDAAAAGADFSRTAGRNRYVILQAWETDRRAALKAADPDVRLLAYANLAAHGPLSQYDTRLLTAAGGVLAGGVVLLVVWRRRARR